MRKLIHPITLIVWFVTGVLAQDRISPSEAARYIGQQATVCGQVVDVRHAARSKGRPTFLNLDRPYPHPIFAAVIWGDDRGKFGGTPESVYKNKRICVTGTITTYRDLLPEIVVSDPSQIQAEN